MLLRLIIILGLSNFNLLLKGQEKTFYHYLRVPQRAYPEFINRFNSTFRSFFPGADKIQSVHLYRPGLFPESPGPANKINPNGEYISTEAFWEFDSESRLVYATLLDWNLKLYIWDKDTSAYYFCRVHYHPTGYIDTIATADSIVAYNASGHVLSRQITGKWETRRFKEYIWQKGKLVRIESSAPGWEKFIEEEYEYDSTGKLLRHLEFYVPPKDTIIAGRTRLSQIKQYEYTKEGKVSIEQTYYPWVTGKVGHPRDTMIPGFRIEYTYDSITGGLLCRMSGDQKKCGTGRTLECYFPDGRTSIHETATCHNTGHTSFTEIHRKEYYPWPQQGTKYEIRSTHVTHPEKSNESRDTIFGEPMSAPAQKIYLERNISGDPVRLIFLHIHTAADGSCEWRKAATFTFHITYREE